MPSPIEPRSSGHIAVPSTSPFGRYAYPAFAGSRDLRFDFLRGFAMLVVISSHLEIFDWTDFLLSERLGLLSAAEPFVVASGLVLGLVNRRVIDKSGLTEATLRLLRRAFVLWRALVVVTLLIILIRALGVLDMTALTTFTDRWAGQTYPMVPPPEVPWHDQVTLILGLRVSPHQVQILGLYVLLLLSTPLWLWLLQRRLFGPYFALTWALYAAGWLRPIDSPILGMQWEFAFPFLIYQVLFTHALAVGFFRLEISTRMQSPATRRLLLLVCVPLALAFVVFAHMTPNPTFPAWSRLEVMSGERWQAIYDAYFVKKRLGIPRLANAAVFFAAFYGLLTYLWVPLNKALGWLLIPLGEASLYVFLMHLVFIALIDQIPGYFDAIPIGTRSGRCASGSTPHSTSARSWGCGSWSGTRCCSGSCRDDAQPLGRKLPVDSSKTSQSLGARVLAFLWQHRRDAGADLGRANKVERRHRGRARRGSPFQPEESG